MISVPDGVGWLTSRLDRLCPGKDPVPIVQEAGWAPGPVWTGAETFMEHDVRLWTTGPIVAAGFQNCYEIRDVWKSRFKKRVKGRFMGFFQHCGNSAYCILNPNKFPHSPPEAPRIIQMRETSTSEGGNHHQ